MTELKDKMKETRIIALYDYDNNYLIVETNAPASIIEDAIAYKDDMLENDDPSFRSDFEEMQEYIQERNYVFNELGYVYELENYSW